MNKYISILRGINVSGQKRIKMADLKYLFNDLGFENIQTYIQSGNVIFESSIKKSAILKSEIERILLKEYGFEVPVEIRTNIDIQNIINACPFGSVDIEKEGTKVLVMFLSEIPAPLKVDEIIKYVIDPEKLIIKNKDAYLYCPNGYGKSKLSNRFLEKKLEVVGTTRNWKTLLKLKELSM